MVISIDHWVRIGSKESWGEGELPIFLKTLHVC